MASSTGLDRDRPRLAARARLRRSTARPMTSPTEVSLEVADAFDRAAVELDDDVADAKAGAGGRAGLEQLDDLETARPAETSRDRRRRAVASRRRCRGRRAGRGRGRSGRRGCRASPRRSGRPGPRPIPATAVLIPTTRPRESASAPPELPGIERGVGLDDVLDEPAGPAVAGRQRAAEGADDARRDRAGEAERVPDRDDQLSDAEPLGITERRRRRAAAVASGRPRGPTAGRGRRPRTSSSAPSTNVAVPRSEPATTWAEVTR